MSAHRREWLDIRWVRNLTLIAILLGSASISIATIVVFVLFVRSVL